MKYLLLCSLLAVWAIYVLKEQLALYIEGLTAWMKLHQRYIEKMWKRKSVK